MQKILHLTLVFYFINLVIVYAQESSKTDASKADYRLAIQKATASIELDGYLKEADWKEAAIATDFWQSKPQDGAKAVSKTEVMMTYDDRNLYIAAICYDDLEGNYVIQSLKRDFSFPVSDAFAVFIDPFNNQTAGFSFAVNPMNVQREGLVQSGGQFGVTTSWDHKWYSKTTRQEGKWVVEMAIPFKTLRFSEGVKEWGINFARNDLKRVETSTWCPVPTQYNVASMAFTGKIDWDVAPTKKGSNINLIPYVSAGLNQDVAAEEAVNFKPNAGMDAKIALSSSLNLDLTINPDFSQVEVDRQVTNLERFSIFFPERRNFFLENSDLFSYGVPPIRPFFSRRIGLSGGEIIPILMGARLTGNVGENTRIGLMSVQTEGGGDVESENFAVATVQQKIWARSNVSGYLINRQSFDGYSVEKEDYNRLAGAEFNFRSTDNKWDCKVIANTTFTDEEDPTFDQGALGKRAMGTIFTGYDSRSFVVINSLEYVGQQYRPEVGFAQELYHRNDEEGTVEPVGYLADFHILGYRYYPQKSKNIRFHAIEFRQKLFFGLNDFSLNDRNSTLEYFFITNNNGAFSVSYQNTSRRLFFPTNITGSMDSLLQAKRYNYNEFQVIVDRSKRNRFYGRTSATYGGFYNGTKLTLTTDVTYRAQPWGNFGLTVAYNDIQFPEGYGDARLFLLGPRIELTFTNSLFFTTFLQYNTQSENFNINSRLQWRYAPMSDFFLVFTDNINTLNGQQKNWGLVLKWNYWLTL